MVQIHFDNEQIVENANQSEMMAMKIRLQVV